MKENIEMKIAEAMAFLTVCTPIAALLLLGCYIASIL